MSGRHLLACVALGVEALSACPQLAEAVGKSSFTVGATIVSSCHLSTNPESPTRCTEESAPLLRLVDSSGNVRDSGMAMTAAATAAQAPVRRLVPAADAASPSVLWVDFF